MAESLNTQLANAVAAIAVASERLEVMQAAADMARREETIARNAANEAQKHFDDLLAQVKMEAPQGTDWKRRPTERAQLAP